MNKKTYVVQCTKDGTYWCGLNHWDKQLRKAQMFHSLKYANDVCSAYAEVDPKLVEVNLSIVPENPTYADKLRSATAEELASYMAQLIMDYTKAINGRNYTPNENVVLELTEELLAQLKQPLTNN